jgi:hypothetical protein
MSKVGEKSHPFFQCLKKAKDFYLTPECEQAFSKIKDFLASLPVLAQPKQGDILILYIYASDIAVSVALVKEEGGIQQPVYSLVEYYKELKFDISLLNGLLWL